MKKKNFKHTAQQHQLQYFSPSQNQSSIPKEKRKGRAQEHWLNEDAAKNGNIFYFDYNIFEAAQQRRWGRNDTPEWFYDTLRSQHIPFNFFIPLVTEKQLAADAINLLLNLKIKEISEIEIEYPAHYKNPLQDRTSFDVFVSYLNEDKEKGLIGIEVKYTEGGYSPTKTEKEDINNSNSIYYSTTKKSNLYKAEFVPKLKENAYRQIWRNHLLAYSFADKNEFKVFTSLTLYHEGNEHFQKAFEVYQSFLSEEGKTTLKDLTFSKFCVTLAEIAKTMKQKKWVLFLIDRYDIQTDSQVFNQLKDTVK